MTVPSLILRLEPLVERSEPSAAVLHPARPSLVDLASGDVGLGEGAPGEGATATTALGRWSAAVAAAHDACLVLDPDGAVVSISPAATELLGCGDGAVIGRQLLDVIDVVDLETGESKPDYASRITPLASLHGPGLVRSLLRVRHQDDTLVTVDTASSPIHDVSAAVVGSVTFLAPIASL